MGKICASCKKEIGFFEDYYELPGEVKLCKKCKKVILEDLISLYYVESEQEFAQKKAKILGSCKANFNATITNAVVEEIKAIYEGRQLATTGEDIPVNETEEEVEVIQSVETETQAEKEQFYQEQARTYYSNTNNSQSSGGMYADVGGKIKALASFCAWCGIIASVIGGFLLAVEEEDLVLVGFLIMVLGSLGSWLSSLLLYAFGQLVQNTDILVKKANEQK